MSDQAATSYDALPSAPNRPEVAVVLNELTRYAKDAYYVAAGKGRGPTKMPSDDFSSRSDRRQTQPEGQQPTPPVLTTWIMLLFVVAPLGLNVVGGLPACFYVRWTTGSWLSLRQTLVGLAPSFVFFPMFVAAHGLLLLPALRHHLYLIRTRQTRAQWSSILDLTVSYLTILPVAAALGFAGKVLATTPQGQRVSLAADLFPLVGLLSISYISLSYRRRGIRCRRANNLDAIAEQGYPALPFERKPAFLARGSRLNDSVLTGHKDANYAWPQMAQVLEPIMNAAVKRLALALERHARITKTIREPRTGASRIHEQQDTKIPWTQAGLQIQRSFPSGVNVYVECLAHTIGQDLNIDYRTFIVKGYSRSNGIQYSLLIAVCVAIASLLAFSKSATFSQVLAYIGIGATVGLLLPFALAVLGAMGPHPPPNFDPYDKPGLEASHEADALCNALTNALMAAKAGQGSKTRAEA